MTNTASAPIDLHITVTMLSDWHIGMGAGRQHSIDRLITRDQHGLPFIPASTLRGIWRDAAERLAFGLDSGKDGAWSSLIAHLFGTQVHPDQQDDVSKIKAPLASALYCRSLHLGSDLISALGGADNAQLRDATTFIKPGVAIDAHSGMAKDDHLRFEEVAIGGHVLSGTAWLDASKLAPYTQDDAIAVLVASAALIERLGAKRRRGLGRCSVAVKTAHIKLADAIKRLEGVPERSELANVPADPTVSFHTTGGSAGKEWCTLEFKVSLVSPLIVPDEILGNVVTTQHAIPGSYLLPLVARAAEAAGIADVFGLIARGELRVLPGHPEVEGRRGLPAALCWEAPKIKDASVKPRSILVQHAKDPQQFKAIRRGFVAINGDHVTLLDAPLIELTTHNVIEDAVQRPTEKVGGVYSYEAIASGQSCRFEVLLWGQPETSNAIAEKLVGRHWLGRGKQAGYGQINIECAEAPKTNIKPSGVLTNSAFLDVWLTSDLILYNEFLEAVTEPDEIAAHLSEKLDCAFSVAAHAVRSRRIESWHTRWGLPRPTLVAVQAGSVIRLNIPKTAEIQLLFSRLADLEREGIGERRAEGFGDVRFNEPRLAELPCDFTRVEAARAAQPSLSVPSENLSASSADFLKVVGKRADRRKQDELAASDASKVCGVLGFAVGDPTSSQLGIVRALLGSSGAIDGINAWLAKEEAEEKERRNTLPGWQTKLKSFIDDKSASPEQLIAQLSAAIAYQQRENKKKNSSRGDQS